MQMKKLVSVILAVCMLVSMFTILPLSAGAETATKTITVGVVDYLNLSGDYQVHYWGGAASGDAAATAINTQKQKSVGQAYWDGGKQTYNMFEASIPADATGFKFHIGETWFGDDGNTADSNAVYVFEYDGNYLAYYDNETPAAPETQVPTTAPETQAPTTAPASEAPVADTITVYFTDALNWGAANIYYWNGGPDWPGTAMTVYEESNDFGQKVYSATIPAAVDGIIFNANGNQTVDIMTGIEDGKGWYTINEKEDNKFKVGEFTVDETETTAPTTAPETTAPETTAPETTAPETTAPVVGEEVTLYFSNNKGWGNVNAHMWKEGGESTEWPGAAATFVGNNDYGEGIYSVTINTATYDHVIFNGNGGQTANIAVADAVAGGCGVYCLDTQDGEGHYNVGFYEYSAEPETQAPSTAPETTAPETTAPETTAPVVGEEVTLYFTNNKGWDNVNAHMWKDGGESTEWPGAAATYVGNNDYGEAIYSATIDTAKYDHVIFNGNGGQTANIAVADAVAGGCGVYCLDTQDGEGHYNVGFYQYNAEPSSEPSSEPSTEPVVGGPTYYIVGGMTNWEINSAYALTKNTAADTDEYMFEGLALTTTSQFKVVRYNGSIQGGDQAWYPDGMGNNYGENGEITADGTYTIYFRPNYDGGEGWFYNCIYVAEFVAPVTEPASEPVTEPASEPATEPASEPSDLNGIVDGFYYENGELVKGKGLVEFEGDIYFVKNDGSIYTNGTLKVVEAKTNGLLPAGNYTFNAEGKRVSDGLVDGYFYVNGVKAKGAGVVEYKNCFYFVKNDGSVYTNGRLSIAEGKTNGLLPAAAYNINEDGKILCNGAINGYFYIDGDKAKGAGVVSYGKALYFVKNDGTFYKNGRLQVVEAKTNGLVAAGAYNFDADGKMQDVKRIIKGYYYLNGQKVPGAGLIEYRGDLYFVKNNGAVYTSGRLLVTEAKANGLVPEGRYTFDADGKMLLPDQIS